MSPPQDHASIAARYADERQRWGRLFAAAAAADTVAEVPSAYTCAMTLEVYREPVVTSAGNSYERHALLAHLEQVRSCALCVMLPN